MFFFCAVHSYQVRIGNHIGSYAFTLTWCTLYCEPLADDSRANSPTVGWVEALWRVARFDTSCHFLPCQICVRTRSSEPSCWTSSTNTTASWSLSSNTRPRCADERPVRGVVGKRCRLLATCRNYSCGQNVPVQYYQLQNCSFLEVCFFFSLGKSIFFHILSIDVFLSDHGE